MHELGPIDVHQFPCLADNYGFLVRDRESGEVAAIDTPDAARITEEAEKLGWRITHIFNTHWHPDHAGGNEAVKDRWGAEIFAPEEGGKIAVKDRIVRGGDRVILGETAFEVIAVPGHTLGHIAYHVPEAGAAFVGDTVFSMGCGRMFEGDRETFWSSLQKLKALPPETVLFCAHEYTLANAAFALSVDPSNEALVERQAAAKAERERGEPTVPVRLADELSVNPFLRADDQGLAASIGLEGASPAEVFGELRRRKDAF
ncbi:hydroxyacylglutathione hydrolase [Parvularcula maris]|uniref:Hydroxyacylglutathione hydrolase n=1 Tax=Parvularcula maris TaxID=2965077 RepID=A0A9X2RIB2_9PROT|nr:hydroxyacylglutathione hydrolase [Parvularcula maris]MCQ8185850.1 hydroxyacylglutathione hydrolase [Parvularcula maris]